MGQRSVLIGAVAVPARWLRDHGDDPCSVDPTSAQRVVDTFAIPRDVEAIDVHEGDTVLRVDWSDGASTTHDLETLTAVVAHPRSAAPRVARSVGFDPGAELWSTPPTEPRLFAASVIDDDVEWIAALVHLRRHGWVAFTGAEPGTDAVQRLARRVGYPRASIFGEVWEMAPGAEEHKDSAYDPVALDVHTDGTYSHDAPGTILFVQQARDGTGGDSVLVDGFAAVRDFVATEPAAADLLTRYEIRGRYLEPGVHLEADRTPLRLDGDGVLRQVTFNNYDRAPVLPEASVVDDLIDAYAAFRATVNDENRSLHLEWEPGRVLLVDNWRLLHGRTAYTGSRAFLGCYTNHEDLESSWRLAGL